MSQNRLIVFAIGSAEIGGAQRILYELIRDFGEKGFEIIVFAPDGPLIDLLKNNNWNFVLVRYTNFRFYLDLFTVFRRKDLIVINTHLAAMSVFFGLFNFFFSRRIISTLHNQIVHEKLTRLQIFFYPKVYYLLSKLVDRIIVNSSFMKEHLINLAKVERNAIEVIPNGISADQFLNYTGGVISNDGKFIVTFIGRLSKEKGVDIFIRSLVYLNRSLPIEFWIIGDGPMEQYLKEIIREIEIDESRVKFKGFVADIRSYIKSSDIVVLPSRNEAFGVVILEAFAFRKTVIASDVGGIPEIIDDGMTGLLFRDGNSEHLALLIESMYQNPEELQLIGRRAYKVLCDSYLSDKMVDRTLGLFSS
jgi:glycosyltransferase involved in cell wall biosynthesis